MRVKGHQNIFFLKDYFNEKMVVYYATNKRTKPSLFHNTFNLYGHENDTINDTIGIVGIHDDTVP